MLAVNIAGEMLEIHQTGRSKVIFFDALNDAWQNYIVSNGNERFQAEKRGFEGCFHSKRAFKINPYNLNIIK